MREASLARSGGSKHFAAFASRLIIKAFHEFKIDPTEFFVILVKSDDEDFCISDDPALEDIAIKAIQGGTFMPISPKIAVWVIGQSPETTAVMQALGIEDQGSITISAEEARELNRRQIKNCITGAMFRTQDQAKLYQGTPN